MVDSIAGPVHWCAIRQVADVVHEDGTGQRRASRRMPILNLMLRDWRYKRSWRQNLLSVIARTIDAMNEVYSFEPKILLVLLLGSSPSRTGATNCHKLPLVPFLCFPKLLQITPYHQHGEWGSGPIVSGWLMQLPAVFIGVPSGKYPHLAAILVNQSIWQIDNVKSPTQVAARDLTSRSW